MAGVCGVVSCRWLLGRGRALGGEGDCWWMMTVGVKDGASNDLSLCLLDLDGRQRWRAGRDLVVVPMDAKCREPCRDNIK